MSDHEELPFVYRGGCQCGAIRYEARSGTNDAYYCHCRMCQRAVGNIAATFLNVKKSNVTWETATPAKYESSVFARRGFCRRCGTPLTFEYVDSENIDLTVGSLDDPSSVHPNLHFGVESRVPTFHVDIELSGKRTEDTPHIMKKWKDAYGDDVVPGPDAPRVARIAD